MKKYLINFVIFLMFSLNVVSASEKDYGNLTEITLQKGLNEKQAREVAIGLEEKLTNLFNYWLTDSHFVNGTKPNIEISTRLEVGTTFFLTSLLWLFREI